MFRETSRDAAPAGLNILAKFLCVVGAYLPRLLYLLLKSAILSRQVGVNSSSCPFKQVRMRPPPGLTPAQY